MIGVFTTIKIKNGIPLFFEKHADRLLSHAKQLNLGPITLSSTEIHRYLQTSNLTDCALKITVTKQQDKTMVTMKARPLPIAKAELKLITIPDTRDELKIYKTTERSINEQAKKIAEENGADDAFFIVDGTIIESTICNVFSFNKKGQIITPNLDGKGLRGITRQIIMEQINVIEEQIPQETRNPLVLVNSLRIQRATHLNARPIADGKPLLKLLQTCVEKAEKAYRLR